MQIDKAQFNYVVEALNVVLPLQSPADAILRQFFRDRPTLGARDRALVAETVYTVLRRRRVLETLLPTPSSRALALLALIKFQGISIREIEPLLRKGEQPWLATAKSTDVSTLPTAVQADLPDWIAEKITEQYGSENMLELARVWREPAPLDLRVNTMLANREEVLAELAKDGIEATATKYSPMGIRLKDKPSLQSHPLFKAGKIEIQDEGSQLLGLLVAPKRRDMVVDFCAGAGGKTLLLGAMMSSQGRLYAFDVSEKRLNNLKPRLARSGLSNIQPQRIDSERDIKIKRLGGKIDRVLVDAPCTGLGTLRRNPDLKWRQTPESLVELTDKQFSILHSASILVKVGGHLVYGTCSPLKEENESIIEKFLSQHPDFELISAEEILASQQIDIQCGEMMRLDPRHHQTDGFFAAVMRRKPKEILV